MKGARNPGLIAAGGLLLLALLSTGCTSWMNRTENKLDRVVNDTRELRWEQQKLAEEVTDIRTLLEGEGLIGDERRAALLTRLRALEQSVEQLNARGQEQDLLLRRMSAALDQLIRQSPALIPPPAVIEEPEVEERVDTESVAVDSVQVAPDSVEEAPPELVLYDAAMSDFRSGNYLLARQGYEELVYRYPNSQLAANAAYWLAETLYAERDYGSALARFKEIEEAYPTAEILPSVLLKIAYTQLELGNEEEAVLDFRRVILHYPDSEEAVNAGHRLEVLAPEDEGSP